MVQSTSAFVSRVGKLETKDWDFSHVRDDDLHACCLWEYGRESAMIGFSASKQVTHAEVRSEKEGPQYTFSEADYDGFLDAFWKSDEGYIEFYEVLRTNGGPNARPWQALPVESREQLRSAVGHRVIGGALDPAQLRELESLWRKNSAIWDAARNAPGYCLEEDVESFEPSQPWIAERGLPSEPHGELIAALSIDFQRHTDDEILESFKSWLHLHRPKTCPTPIRRGHNKRRDWRAALERLAVMRILHCFTRREVMTKLPEAEKLYANKEWYKERKLAAANFLKFLPFLPKTSRPVSWETAGERRQRVEKRG